MDNLQPALDIIKKWEGCRLTSYLDPVGVWTIGYGTTQNVVHDETISLEKANALLYQDVVKLEGLIKKLVTVQITNNQLCALISFCYNLGINALHHSTLLVELNRGADKVTVSEQFLLWVHAGGHILQGLVSRRKDEAKLFLS